MQSTHHTMWPRFRIVPRWQHTPLTGAVWTVLAITAWCATAVAGMVAFAEHHRADRLARLAGMTPVNGPGVEVR